MKMSEKTLKLGDIEVNKKEFHASIKPVALALVNINQIVTSDKFKHSDKGSKYFIGYDDDDDDDDDDDIIRPLCIALPQMSGYMKNVDNGGKNMSFVIENDSVLIKYIEIWNKFKKEFDIKFDREPVYDENYIRTKVKRLMV